MFAQTPAITPGSIITTIAGTGAVGFSGDGGAINAKLDGPTQFAVDAAGNIYFPDRGNNRIRKIDTSGVITTIAETGTAGLGGRRPGTNAVLNAPIEVNLDEAGNI